MGQVEKVNQDNPMATVVQVSHFHDIAEELSKVSEVSKVFSHQHGTEINVWTVVPGFDRSVRDEIYKIEQAIQRRAGILQINFRVVADESEVGQAGLIFDRAA